LVRFFVVGVWRCELVLWNRGLGVGECGGLVSELEFGISGISVVDVWRCELELRKGLDSSWILEFGGW
jgi:hypothetical protein